MRDFLIQIENIPFPLSFMDRSSWSCTPFQRRIIGDFNDIDGVRHVYESPHYRTEIQFTIREHSEAEHAQIVPFFSKLSKASVIYWNDMANDYETGVFRIDTPVFSHKKTFNDTMWYEPTTIKMTEY
jgi:hypothetical protein